MTGEKLAWFRVASHLHQTVEGLAENITYREFLSWLDYLGWAEGRTEKIEYYLAQIAAEVRRGYVKHPRSVKTKDFILRSTEKQAPSKSKTFWLNFLNLKPSE